MANGITTACRGQTRQETNSARDKLGKRRYQCPIRELSDEGHFLARRRWSEIYAGIRGRLVRIDDGGLAGKQDPAIIAANRSSTMALRLALDPGIDPGKEHAGFGRLEGFPPREQELCSAFLHHDAPARSSPSLTSSEKYRFQTMVWKSEWHCKVSAMSVQAAFRMDCGPAFRRRSCGRRARRPFLWSG